MFQNDKYLDALKNLKFLVLDEADRMVEGGHFQELDQILKVISQYVNDLDFGDLWDIVARIWP